MTKLERAMATMAHRFGEIGGRRCDKSPVWFWVVGERRAVAGDDPWRLAHEVTASLLLDGSPGGRWPHPLRRTARKKA